MRTRVLTSFFILLPLALWMGCQGHPQNDTGGDNVQNYEWHLVIAENGLSKERLLEAGEQFQDLVGNRAASGDVVTLYSAPSLETICSIVVPKGHAKVRLRDPSVRKIASKLGKVFTPETAAEGTGHVRLPDLVNTISSGRRTGFPSRVIIVGSPLFIEPTYLDWSMTEGKFPSDETLKAEYSPYNIEGKYPDKTEITWLVPKPRWGMHSQYEQAVVRFNRLLVQEQAASIIRVTNDAQMAFIFENPQFTDTLEAKEEPALMHQFRQDEKPTVRQAEASTSTEDVEAVLASAQADNGKIALAIEWTSEEQNCDLDLWIECKGHAEKLSYKKTTTPFGKHFRDVTSSTGDGANGTDFRGMEWLEINHNRLDDLTCWIHVFRGSKPATVRFIRVWNGQRSEKTIQINPSPKWNKIDLGSF